MFQAKKQRGHFTFGNLRVPGRFNVAADGGLEFVIFRDHLPPGVFERLPGQISETTTRLALPDGPLYKRRREVSVTVPAPLLWELLMQGVDRRTIMETLGHSQIGLTMNPYSHVLPTLQAEAAAKMDAILLR